MTKPNDSRLIHIVEAHSLTKIPLSIFGLRRRLRLLSEGSHRHGADESVIMVLVQSYAAPSFSFSWQDQEGATVRLQLSNNTQ